LAFPEVFDAAGKGGFDVVLGNPPWERVKLQEKEFFEAKDEAIAGALNASVRKKMIAELQKNNPELWEEYHQALHTAEALSKFFHLSGCFPLGGRGDVNLYQVFAEKDRSLMATTGRVGIIVPTGIATDDSNKYLFADLVEKNQIASLFDFENRKGIFQDVHRSYKFCLFTLLGSQGNVKTSGKFAFFLYTTDDLQNKEKVFELGSSDFELLNPNTRTCPIFRTRSDANLTRKLYHQAPVLVNEVTGENPWEVSFKQGHFNMTSDSHLFHTKEQLESLGFRLHGNVFEKGDKKYLPLYEAKLFHHYDHRFATFINKNEFIENTNHNPDSFVSPRYWLDINLRETYSCMLSFRNTCINTNVRTGIFCIISNVFVGNNAPILLSNHDAFEKLLMLTNLSSFIFDYIIRNKMGGLALNFYILEQIPVIPLYRFSKFIRKFIAPRVFELVYTAWDLREFADSVWNSIDSEIEELLSYQRLDNASETGVSLDSINQPLWAMSDE